MKIQKHDFAKTIHVCPNGCHAALSTTAHVMQDWKVDLEGKRGLCFFNDTAATEIYTLSYTRAPHGALPIWLDGHPRSNDAAGRR